MKRLLPCAIALAIAAGIALSADVKTQQKSQVKFEGTLGTMMGLFGGKAAKEGVVETVAVSGNRKMTTGETTGEIVDLNEEKVYELDLRSRTYKVTTFDELRRRMQEAQARAEKDAQKPQDRKGNEPQYEADIDAKDTGQRRTINNFDCRQVITTIAVHEKGKTIDQAGGLVMTADSWLTQPVAAMKEIGDFNLRYAEKLMGASFIASAEQMAAAMAMYPGLKAAMAKYQANAVSMNGTPILTSVKVEVAKSPEQVAAEQKPDEKPSVSGGIGGMLGGLGRRVARKKDDQAGGDKTRALIMTTNTEVMSISTNVDSGAVALPAGFKQK